MQKLCLSLGTLLLVCGCATTSSGPAVPAIASSGAVESAPRINADAVPMETVEISDFAEVTICEEIKRPGSRIVVGEYCYTQDPRMAAVEDELRKQEVLLVQEQMRREQENMERMQRELEMARQRSMIERSMR